MEDNKNYERGEHLENITDASMKDDDYFNASRNIDRKYITIEGARENNLKNINVKIPRDKFVVVTGLSGSGKSSLAFDTIYADVPDGQEGLGGFPFSLLSSLLFVFLCHSCLPS